MRNLILAAILSLTSTAAFADDSSVLASWRYPLSLGATRSSVVDIQLLTGYRLRAEERVYTSETSSYLRRGVVGPLSPRTYRLVKSQLLGLSDAELVTEPSRGECEPATTLAADRVLSVRQRTVHESETLDGALRVVLTRHQCREQEAIAPLALDQRDVAVALVAELETLALTMLDGGAP